MENTIEIAPNQLPLFTNMLTVEQEQRLTEAKASATKQMNRQKDEVLRKMKLVIDAGFSPAQYSYSIDCKKVMRSINVNHWSHEAKMVEAELDQFDGNFYIVFDQYDNAKNEIVKRRASIELYGDQTRNGKIECYGLNQSSRKMKPETILANIAKAAEKAHYEFARANTVKSIVKYTVNKYKKLYPNAEVEAGKAYNSGRGNYEEFDIVTVKFKSGSYIVLRTTTTPDGEYAHKKYDAMTNKMTNDELMDHFNAQ
jgi:hypothetical protein